MAQNYKDMTLAQLEKANQDLTAQRVAIKQQQMAINAEISTKMDAEKAARQAPSQVLKPPGVVSAEEIGKP
jgi:hypothetical protein